MMRNSLPDPIIMMIMFMFLPGELKLGQPGTGILLLYVDR
jgi:hypothetical protein